MTPSSFQLSATIGERVLTSMVLFGRLPPEKARDPAMAQEAANQLLTRVYAILAAVGQLKQLSYPGGRLALSEHGQFIEPFCNELIAQVAIAPSEAPALMAQLFVELREGLGHPALQSNWGRLVFQEGEYLMELAR
jgi:hypothetical protein